MPQTAAHAITEAFLHEIKREDVHVREVEPHLYSVYPETENVGSYDRISGIYDRIACNRIYNRIMWGYSTSEYHTFCSRSLADASDGWVLDAGCGSLAFTAETYVQYAVRPVVLLDQSIRMLRMAMRKIMRLRGSIPPNMIFLHADALDLPFRHKSFKTIICLNLLHIFNDVRPFLNELKEMTTSSGCTMSFTTLVLNNRLSDAYLKALANAGALVARSPENLVKSFSDVAIPVNLTMKGNLAFLSTDPRQ
jgi:ubiquinone/menaquinone biosynthesis C-methylase UbiE